MASVACEEAKENTNTIQIHHPNMRFQSTEKPMAKKEMKMSKTKPGAQPRKHLWHREHWRLMTSDGQ